MQAHTTAETSAIHPPTATSLFRNASEVSTLTPQTTSYLSQYTLN